MSLTFFTIVINIILFRYSIRQGYPDCADFRTFLVQWQVFDLDIFTDMPVNTFKGIGIWITPTNVQGNLLNFRIFLIIIWKTIERFYPKIEKLAVDFVDETISLNEVERLKKLRPLEEFLNTNLYLFKDTCWQRFHWQQHPLNNNAEVLQGQ